MLPDREFCYVAKLGYGCVAARSIVVEKVLPVSDTVDAEADIDTSSLCCFLMSTLPFPALSYPFLPFPTLPYPQGVFLSEWDGLNVQRDNLKIADSPAGADPKQLALASSVPAAPVVVSVAKFRTYYQLFAVW